MARFLLIHSPEHKECSTRVTMVIMMSNFTSGLKKLISNRYTRDKYFFSFSWTILALPKEKVEEKWYLGSYVVDPDAIAVL